MSLIPGFNPEGLGLQVGMAMLEEEQKRKAELKAEIGKETDELTKRLADDLCLGYMDVPLVAMRVLAKLVRDGTASRGDIADLRTVRRF